MNFIRPEHEFLRQASRTQPDWDVMRTVVTTACDWGYLRRTALLHQLDGVVAWRSIAPEMDGYTPEIVRQDYLGYLQWLTVRNADWARDAAHVLTSFKLAGIPTAILSGLPSFALYEGMGFWPKVLEDLDLIVPFVEYNRVRTVLDLAEGKARERHLVSPVGDKRFSFPEFLDVHAFPPHYGLMSCAATYADPMMYERMQVIHQWGLELPVPRPAVWLCQQAYRLYTQLQWVGAPLYLGALARLAAIVEVQAVDWHDVVAILLYLRNLTEWRMTTTSDEANVPATDEPWLVSRTCPSVKVTWILKRLEAAYPGTIPTTFWIEVEDITVIKPTVLARGGYFDSDGCQLWSPGVSPPADDNLVYCEWAQLPEIEDFLFTWYSTRGIMMRLRSGLWRILDPEVRVSIDEPDWATVHLLDKWAKKGKKL